MAITRYRLQQKLMFLVNDDLPKKYPKLDESNVYLTLAEWIQRVTCFFLGHYPISDNCGNPLHNYCAWCTKPTPNQAAK